MCVRFFVRDNQTVNKGSETGEALSVDYPDSVQRGMKYNFSSDV